jgi:hypothetical protein
MTQDFDEKELVFLTENRPMRRYFLFQVHRYVPLRHTKSLSSKLKKAAVLLRRSTLLSKHLGS